MKLALFGLAFAAVAFATPVTYNTLDSELCLGAAGCGTNTQVMGAITVTFEMLGNSTVDPAAVGGTTSGSFGNIIISCTGGGNACGAAPLDGLMLYINIEQISPLAGSGSIPSGVITGMIAGSASAAVITWPNPSTTVIEGYQYSIANNPLALVPVTTNNGKTTVQGLITELPPGNTDIPEPSTYMLLSAGLLAIGVRKFKRAA